MGAGVASVNKFTGFLSHVCNPELLNLSALLPDDLQMGDFF